MLRGSLRKAAALRLIKYNPFEAVQLMPHKAVHRRALELDEQRIIYENITIEKYKRLFYFLCNTGIRIDRALSLTAGDFDKRRNIINVFNKQRRGQKSYYQVSYLPNLIDIPERGAIFPEITYTSARLYFERLFIKLEINGVSLHSFRHTFISNCYHAKIDLKQIQEWAGHATFEMTADTYTHLLKNGTSPLLEYIKQLKKVNRP